MSRFVYIVDDEADVRASVRALLSTRPNLVVQPFASGDQFLKVLADREDGVVLLDVHMPGRNGLEVLRALPADRFRVVIITGQGDIPMAVQAMRSGAHDFLEKPYAHQALFGALDNAFAMLEAAADDTAARAAASERIERLSPRERETLELIVQGQTNKAIGEILDISVRTVEVHRANLMAKLDARTVSDAVRIAFASGLAG